MSSYDAAAQQLETEEQQQEQSYLSQEERDTVKRILKFPEEFPKELGAWVEDYMGTHGTFQKSQVQGLPLLFTQMQDTLEQLEEVVDQLSVIGTTYQDDETSVNVSGGGSSILPQVTSLPAGTYFCILTAQAEITAGGGDITMRMYSSEDGVFGSVAYWSDSTASGERQMLVSIGSTTFSSTGSISAWGAEGGNGTRTLHGPALIALRTG